MREDGQGFVLARFRLQASEIFLPPWIVPQQQASSLRAGPLELGMAHRRPRGPGACARRLLGPFDEATGGDAILDPGEVGEVMHRVEQDHTHNLANAGNRVEPREALRIVRLCCLEDRQRDVAAQPLIVVKESAVDCDTFLHGRLREPLGYPSAVGFLRALFPDLRQVILAVGMPDLREPRGTFPRERHATPQESTRSAHLRRRDIRLRQQAATQQDGNLLGGDRVVCGLATMDRLHREGRAQDKRQPLLRPEIGEPIPREETCDGDDKPLALRSNGLEKGCGSCWHVAVQHDRAVLTQDTDVQGAGMQVDAAVKWMLLGVEAHAVSSSCE